MSHLYTRFVIYRKNYFCICSFFFYNVFSVITPFQTKTQISTTNIFFKLYQLHMLLRHFFFLYILLTGVRDYLPSPLEHAVEALDLNDKEKPVSLEIDSSKPLVSLAFKLEESRFGQLTYVRTYQGTLKRGDWMINTSNGKKVKVPRLVSIHTKSEKERERAIAYNGKSNL